MMWWLVVFASAGLIALGTGLLVRDLIGSRTEATNHDAKRSSDSRASVRQSMTTALASVWSEKVDAKNSPSRRPDSRAVRPSKLEKKWSRLRKEVDVSVAAANQSMGQLAVAIGSPGQATWSLDNEGFGDYRRVRIEQESVAWLRLEVTGDRRIRSRLRTHDAQFASLNRDAEAAVDGSKDELVAAIAASLAGIFDFAVKRHSDLIRHEAPGTADAQINFTHQAATSSFAGEQTSAGPATAPPLPASMPSPSAALVDAAVSLVNRAFAEADAALVPAADRRGAKAHSDRTLSIVASNTHVGLMLIEPRSDRIDISVGMLDQTNAQTTRKQAQPMAGLTVHALAEAIATNAWPAIAAASTRTAVA